MIVVDVPHNWALNSNQRLHWSEKARRTRFLRTTAWAVAHTAPIYPFLRRVRCVVDVSWPDRRRRDVHNIMPSVKACIDGIVDARLLVDDSDKYMFGPDLRVSESLCPKGSAFILSFSFEEA